MAELGAANPAAWAGSEMREHIPQPARYQALRRIWATALSPWRDSGSLTGGRSGSAGRSHPPRRLQCGRWRHHGHRRGIRSRRSPRLTKMGVLAAQEWWSGAGSNRRPSAFQAGHFP